MTPILFSLVVALAAAQGASTDCRMNAAFQQPDNRGETNVAVWQGDNALLFGETLHVNTDGTRRSYSVSDFWGEERALNNLCNAMTDACAGLSSDQLRARRIETQQARARGWPTAALERTRLSSSIIAFQNGRPCPEVDGYLVSATALRRARVSDVCDIQNYVDALTVPAIVLPKRRARGVPTPFEDRGARIGDLAAVISSDGSRVVFAVVGDLGPAQQLGEGSVALNGALLGRSQPPANYREIRGRAPFRGRGWDVPMAFVLIFPGTADASEPYMSVDRIDAAANRAFERWGGRSRLNACRLAYSRRGQA